MADPTDLLRGATYNVIKRYGIAWVNSVDDATLYGPVSIEFNTNQKNLVPLSDSAFTSAVSALAKSQGMAVNGLGELGGFFSSISHFVSNVGKAIVRNTLAPLNIVKGLVTGGVPGLTQAARGVLQNFSSDMHSFGPIASNIPVVGTFVKVGEVAANVLDKTGVTKSASQTGSNPVPTDNSVRSQTIAQLMNAGSWTNDSRVSAINAAFLAANPLKKLSPTDSTFPQDAKDCIMVGIIAALQQWDRGSTDANAAFNAAFPTLVAWYPASTRGGVNQKGYTIPAINFTFQYMAARQTPTASPIYSPYPTTPTQSVAPIPVTQQSVATGAASPATLAPVNQAMVGMPALSTTPQSSLDMTLANAMQALNTTAQAALTPVGSNYMTPSSSYYDTSGTDTSTVAPVVAPAPSNKLLLYAGLGIGALFLLKTLRIL